MDLKDFLGVREVKFKDLYWALVIEPGWVQAGVWEIVDKKAKVVAVSASTPWEVDSELVGACDTALSSAIQNLPEDVKEPSKTVFGVPPSWVDKGQIKEEYLSKIKNVCVDLSLEPTGFVVLPEAIAHLVKAEEGSPLNAAILEVGKDFLEISVFKLGNLVGSTSVSRSVSLFDDVAEGLSRFSASDAIPSRIIIYDGKEGELEESKQLLISARWEALEKVKFLHTPKIEIFDSEKKVLAVSLAGASEMEGITEVAEKKEEQLPEVQVSEEHKNVVEPENPLTPAELGFVVGEDVAKVPLKKEQEIQRSGSIPQQITAKKEFPGISLLKNLGIKIRGIFSRKSQTMKMPTAPKKNSLYLGLGVLGVVIVALFLLWWFYPKADVKIFVTPKTFNEKVQVTLSPDTTAFDVSGKVLPAKVLTTSVSGDKTQATTGTKKVGDKAKGSVNIRNGTDSNLSLPAGTILTAANNLQFSLVNSASVSAALSPINPGTQVADVIAGDIGAEYNLAKDETFKVSSNLGNIDAVSTANFTGGSSQQISAVSADDAENLSDSLTKELTDSAKKNLIGGFSSDMLFVDGSQTATPSSKIFSNKVGDEATSFKLSMTLKANAYSVSKDNLNSLAKSVLGGSIPSGFYLTDSGLSFSFSHVKDVGKTSIYDLTITADFLPKEDSTEVAKSLSGKSVSLVEGALGNIPGFSRAEINFVPRVIGRLGFLPRVSKNISVEIVSEK